MRKSNRLPFKESNRGYKGNLTVKLLYDVFTAFQSETAVRAKSALLRGKWDALFELSVDPCSYADASSFGVDYLLCEIASKVPPVVTGGTPERLYEVAIESFMAGEVQCMNTNQSLPLLDSSAFGLKTGHDAQEILLLAREKIERALGSFSWDECSALFGFGPGASTRLNRSKADLYYKFGPKPDTTQHCLTLAAAACGLCPLATDVDSKELIGLVAVNQWGESLIRGRDPTGSLDLVGGRYLDLLREVFNVVKGSKIVTVPKNAKTDRTIAIEPDLNMYVQKGIGAVIRRRLRRVGIDLNSQEHNQRLAKLGSETDELATIDLKSASDTISRRIVELLLPQEWYCAMNMTRSHCGVFSDGRVIPYQKFSSMGNGFTFELETLIFWGISKAVAEYTKLRDSRLAVYGDDIIFPSAKADLLIDILRIAGFTPNVKKTFVRGPFRESCGKHYFRGSDVTPFYLRKEVSHTQPLFVAVNNMRRWITRMSAADGFAVGVCKPTLWRLYQRWMSRVPRRLLSFRGPDGFGDSFLIGNFEECLPNRDARGREGWRVSVYRCVDLAPSGKSRRVDGPPLLLKSLFRLEKRMLEGDGVKCSDYIAETLRSPLYVVRDQLVTAFPVLTWGW